METQELHRGRLIDHIQLVVRDLLGRTNGRVRGNATRVSRK